ncbi:Peroxisomal sarcosine oxidase [Holothuria leucospilota]|uniref:Peroxisomal sarcosine oxidase n=1 Tax=Holothuria leucospilota TaxID=206669 RepID=A0A9Q1CEG2_HOLLE|nr:Peroxisomal sarcosine oxidase [Holothuria leucospilota]
MYDCIVIGAGVVGSSAAYHLSRKGKNTLLLEQFSLPHTRGSSHGPIRAIRCCNGNLLYVKMTIEALRQWKQLEEDAGVTLFRQTGLLIIDKPPYEFLTEAMNAAKVCGIHVTEMSREEVHERYPGMVNLPEESKAFLEEGAGTIKADKALECLRMQIKKYGGHIHEEEKVERIIPGRTVTVKTNKGEYKAKGLIITPGTWASQLLKPLGFDPPIRVKRATVCYWKDHIPGSSKNYPVFIDYALNYPSDFTSPCFAYGFPSDEYPGLKKISVHQGTETVPDDRDGCPSDKRVMEFLLGYMKTRFPELAGEKPSIVEWCMYSLTPDEEFILDNLAHHPNVAIGCGFSGSGFKLAPVLGQILTEMALGDTLSFDMSPFRLSRFSNASVKSKY